MMEWPRGLLLEVAAWGAAIAWVGRTVGAIRNMPRIPDLSSLEADVWPEGTPSLTVVVPARNEARDLPGTLEALAKADYPLLQVLVIDDRSEDATGAIADEYARSSGGRIEARHVLELPDGWLGKTHAMQLALYESHSEYVLFTDADILFSPSVLRRALAYAEHERADHLVVFPTPLIRSRGEGAVLGFFQMLGFWVVRPWRVAEERGKSRSWRDAIGVGAFNMVRREALLQIGGLAPQRMVIIEDVTLARRFRAAGLRQRVAYAPGLVLVHWAAGAHGLVRVMTKNLFSGVNFQPVLLLALCLGIVFMFLLPLGGLFWWRTALPCLGILCAIGAGYRLMNEYTGIDARYGWLYPVGAVLFCWAMLRSMLAAWLQGGVVWRGTHYPLRELRQHNSPWQWRAGKGD